MRSWLVLAVLGISTDALAYPAADCPGTPATVDALEPLESAAPRTQGTVRRHSQWGLQWAFELPPTVAAGFSGSVSWVADTLGFNSTKEFSVAACPGDFDVPAGCRRTGWDGRITFGGGTTPPAGAPPKPTCQLPAAGPTYLNVRDYDCPTGEVCSFALSWDREVVAAAPGPADEGRPREVPAPALAAAVTEAAPGEPADCANPPALLLTQRTLDPLTGDVVGISEPENPREGFVSGQG
jgi:hypothetical protein